MATTRDGAPGMPRTQQRPRRSLGKGQVTPWVRSLVVGLYARTGQWRETARLLWELDDGGTVPADIERDALAARRAVG